MGEIIALGELPKRLRALIQHIELEGYDTFERIRLEGDVKDIVGFEHIEGKKGWLYLVFIPDIEENELTPPEFPSDH